jgi:hypothetical protein
LTLVVLLVDLGETLRTFPASDFLIACREIFERDLVNGFLVKGLAMTSCMRKC